MPTQSASLGGRDDDRCRAAGDVADVVEDEVQLAATGAAARQQAGEVEVRRVGTGRVRVHGQVRLGDRPARRCVTLLVLWSTTRSE